ncbi:XRE family transcriptional regulator [Streptococcus suis]|uniref:XRE family transcriptional regulator n=1 Tax=Streptococcus suis TaxID=1307 RepID=UPI001C963118|nr:XRE family transcriptional regulator [Streptococcus suis]MBY5025350.1 XRE family transcriptional regulator [Streptococcus suis]QZT17416.1 XRE family transcriptional regulator [Streptococcus suis]
MESDNLAIYIGQKIKHYRKTNNLTMEELGNKLHIGKSTIANYEKGFRTPRQKTLFALADVFGVSIDDFFPYSENNQKNNIDSDIVTLANTLTSSNRASWVDYGRELLHKQNASIVEELAITYEVKAVSRLAAGVGFGYDDNEIITVQVTNEPPKHDIASIVDGDSMTPNYQDGDVIYLRDKGISSYSGQVCAVVVDDKTYLKRVYTEATGLRLVSINKKYNDITIDFPPSEDTHIKVFSVVGSDRVI